MIRASAMGMAGVGGAIGPIYAAALLAVAAELQAGVARPAERVPADDQVATIAACAAAALQAVTGLGGAKPGDKTIVDALAPVVSVLRSAASEGQALPSALEAARIAARRGAESTVGMTAAVGRSSRFGERSRGTADPGASSFALIVDALVVSVIGTPERAGDREAG